MSAVAKINGIVTPIAPSDGVALARHLQLGHHIAADGIHPGGRITGIRRGTDRVRITLDFDTEHARIVDADREFLILG